MRHTRVTQRGTALLAWARRHRLAASLSLAWAMPAPAVFAQEPAPAPAPATSPAPVNPEPTTADLLAQERARAEVERIALRAEFVEKLTAERAEREAREKQLAAEYDARLDKRLAETQKAPPSVSGNQGLALSGFVQADLSFRQSSQEQINSSTGAPLNENRFVLRRARLRTSYDASPWSAALELDANTVNGGQVRVIGAEASARLPGSSPMPLAMATVGLFKIPFGWEVMESDRDRLFLERSTVVRALFPGEYDLGARVQGGWQFLRYAVAVQNGEPMGSKTFALRDPNKAKDVVGRVGIDALVGSLTRVFGGVSALYGRGFHKGTPATKSTLSWSDSNEDGIFQNGEMGLSAGQAAQPSANFSRFALGADARLSLTLPWLGQTVLYGEFIWAQNLDRAIMLADPLQGSKEGSARDVRELGYYVGLVQDIGTHFQLGVRFDSYNPDRDSTDRQSALVVPSSMSYRTIALAGALRSGPARLVFEYDINRNHLGRTSTGLPTNLADNVFAVRTEVKF
jgi:hypothetical protein